MQKYRLPRFHSSLACQKPTPITNLEALQDIYPYLNYDYGLVLPHQENTATFEQENEKTLCNNSNDFNDPYQQTAIESSSWRDEHSQVWDTEEYDDSETDEFLRCLSEVQDYGSETRDFIISRLEKSFSKSCSPIKVNNVSRIATKINSDTEIVSDQPCCSNKSYTKLQGQFLENKDRIRVLSSKINGTVPNGSIKQTKASKNNVPANVESEKCLLQKLIDKCLICSSSRPTTPKTPLPKSNKSKLPIMTRKVGKEVKQIQHRPASEGSSVCSRKKSLSEVVDQETEVLQPIVARNKVDTVVKLKITPIKNNSNTKTKWFSKSEKLPFITKKTTYTFLEHNIKKVDRICANNNNIFGYSLSKF